MSRHNTCLAVIFIFYLGFASFPIRESPNYNEIANSAGVTGAGGLLWKFSGGVLGSRWSCDPRIWEFTGSGEKLIALGTDAGLAVIDVQGRLNLSYATVGPVLDAELLGDLNDDNMEDIAVVIDDQTHPNVVAISSRSCQELWYFTPTVDAVDPATFELEAVTTQSWDVLSVGDINGDGIGDLCVSSWYQIFLLSGRTGAVIWSSVHSFKDDAWKVVLIPNYDLAGRDLLLGGSEDGQVIAYDAETGNIRWKFQTKSVINYYRDGSQVKSRLTPNSIDDLCVTQDANFDGVSDVLVTSEDGFIRLLSGVTGGLLSSKEIFQVVPNPSSNPLSNVPDTSPFTAEARIFKDFGLKIIKAPDINSDGHIEYFLTARGLYNYNDFCNEIYLISVGVSISILGSFHSNQPPNQLLYSIGCVKNASDIPVYFLLSSPGIYASASLYNSSLLDLLLNNIDWSEGSTGVMTEEDLAPTSHILSMGDLTGDNVAELLVLTQRGIFGIFNTAVSQMIWSRKIHSLHTSAMPVSDLNSDGISDLVFKHIGRSQIAWDPFNDRDVIVDLVAVDGHNGSVLWRYSMPSFTIYDGLQDLQIVDDITGDGITDFVTWITPVRIPPEVLAYLERLGGSGVLPLSDSTKTYYRSLMANYTRLALIDGSTGRLLWDPPLSSILYRFARSSNYTGTYENPSSQSPGSYKIANRAPKWVPAGWFSSASTYLYTLTWNRPWNITDLYIPNNLEVSLGDITGGSVSSLGKIDENLTIATSLDGGQWSAVFNLTIPTNLSTSQALGAGEFPLSEQDRLSAIKFQTHVSLNNTPIAASLVYSLYNFSSGEWIECNWADTNRIWDSRYPDLHGDYNSSIGESGFRSSYCNFAFAQNNLRPDVMFVVTRGTADADPAVEFDFENRTTLASFVDAFGSIKLRVNVTDSQPLNVTWNSFGLVPFYWGIAPPQFDGNYMYDTIENLGEKSFQDDYLLELDVMSFNVIYGTDDSYADLVVVIGPEFMESYPATIGARIILFDLYNRVVYTRWGTNRSVFPTYFASVCPINSSLNSFVLSGRFKNSTGSYGTTHIFIKEPYWNHNISQFGNYSHSYANMDFRWVYSNPSFRYTWSGVGKVKLNNTGALGIVVGSYTAGPFLVNLTVLNLDSLAVICDIPVIGLNEWSTSAGYDFALGGVGYTLQLGQYDFNHDGWLDHVGLYRADPSSGLTYNYIVVFSGNPLDAGPSRVLFNYTIHTSLIGYNPSDMDLTLPFAVPGDIDSDGVLDLCVGIDAKQAVCRGANISYFSVSNGIETQHQLFDWVLESTDCTSSFGTIDLVQSLSSTRDFTNDGQAEFLLNRNQFNERSGTQAAEPTKISELLDLVQERILYRFTMPTFDFYPAGDVDGDSKDDFCILTSNSILCINADFNVNFTNISPNQKMPAGHFSVGWVATASGARFELRVDGISNGYTLNNTMFLSLGAGIHDIQVLMYDISGIVIAMDSISLEVPAEYDLVFVVGVCLGGIIGLYTYIQYRHNKAWGAAKKTLAKRRGLHE